MELPNAGCGVAAQARSSSGGSERGLAGRCLCVCWASPLLLVVAERMARTALWYCHCHSRPVAVDVVHSSPLLLLSSSSPPLGDEEGTREVMEGRPLPPPSLIGAPPRPFR